jgi:putative membrane protein
MPIRLFRSWPTVVEAEGELRGAKLFVAGQTVAGVVAVVHLYILVLEMFLWRTPRAMKAFGTDPELAARSVVLAANQGLYNGFLAAGLIWGLVVPRGTGFPVLVFFLSCVAVAGIYGAVTVSKKILVVQTIPAAVGLVLLAVGH